jgi:NodT family efflux transporter outer membrane factor (OMF) lipoprotein
MKKAIALPASLVSVLSAGCAVGPEFQRPEVRITQTWSAASDPRVATQAAVDTQWWKTFNDSALDKLVELAYRQNLSLQIAGLKIVQARAQLGIATGRQYPQVQALFGSATAIGISENAVNFLNLPGRNFADFQLGFDAAWELDFWGKYRRGVQSETDAMLASVADYYSGIVSLTAEIARTYVTIRTYEVLIEQAQYNAGIQEQALAIAQSRFRNGATSELDPTQATTLLESTRATIPQLRAGLQQARNALSTLLGQPTGTVAGLLAGPRAIPRATTKVAIGLPAELLRRRPDIRSAELTAAAQCARIGVAKAELYPSFTLVGTIGLRSFASSSTTKNLFSSKSLFYNVGPQINWPFFNYGRLTSAVRVEEALFQQLLVNYRDTVLKAAQEVEDALAGFLEAQDALTFEQNAVTSAQRSVELSVVAYREGATDYQRVLDAQRSLLQQQNNLAQTTSSVATNLIALYKALGGGWEVRQPITPAEKE